MPESVGDSKSRIFDRLAVHESEEFCGMYRAAMAIKAMLVKRFVKGTYIEIEIETHNVPAAKARAAKLTRKAVMATTRLKCNRGLLWLQ